MENTCQIPRKITAGDSVSWVESWGEYPASDYTLKLTLIDTALAQTFTADASGDAHLFTINSVASSLLTSRMVDYQLVAVATDFRKTLDRGRIEVLPDLTNLEKYDSRDWLEQTLDAIEAAIAKRATKTQLKHDIDGVAIEHMSHTELIAARKELRKELSAKRIKTRLAAGKSPFLTINSRFVS